MNKALVLLYLDGRSYQETAEVLGISETNVATKINRLKQTMRQQQLRKSRSMMELDEMKLRWAEHNQKIEERIRLSRQILSAGHLRGAKSALDRASRSVWLGAAIWLALVMALGNFVYENFGMLQFSMPALLLDMYAMGMVAASIHHLSTIRRIDLGGPVAVIQQQLESLRVLRIRTTRWALLAGAVVWAPFAIVVARVLVGLETYSVAWLCANVAFGLVLIPLVYWASERFGDRLSVSPFMQRLMKDIAGQNLEAARMFLGKLAEFGGEDAAAN